MMRLSRVLFTSILAIIMVLTIVVGVEVKVNAESLGINTLEKEILEKAKLGLEIGISDSNKDKVVLVETTNKTEKLQNALKLGAGKIVVLPYDSSFEVSGLKVPDNTTIIGYGSKIYNDKKHMTLLTIGSGVKIYGLEIQGAGNKEAGVKGIGININGPNSANYAKNIVIHDSFIHDIGFYGIKAEFADNVTVTNTNIEDIGYAGIGGFSVSNFNVDKSHIKAIAPGTDGNAYGVFFSRKGSKSDLKQYPRSKDSSVTNSTIEDIPLWEALDTHGGENITFNHNKIRNAKVGIAFVNATGDGKKGIFGTQRSTAKCNQIEGIGKGCGIIVAGSTSDYSSGLTISGNQLTNAGKEGSSISGAICAKLTKDLIIEENTLKNSFANAISINTHNTQFLITKNKIQDVQDKTYVVPAAIAIRSTDNEGTISQNVITGDGKLSNKYVNVRGINISTKTNVKLKIGTNTNTFKLPIAGGTGSHVTYVK
ncbi:right-handed parallel beta-helix repeat-containing protein [Psychrobacillus sp. MER TA 171]|uniref:right-handed parallel beta-helix repeat-containing protein n=1 Tax=Psychrobacillus sp. MER TA 171 TaxID=2939577 RepID=UPI00203B4118|nr:right-handed parallel beta-helix repeat-containing protein [Psychrobacillus sp. MER TA 171]MCM3359760.1 right-handed parallel beta-helix repeat-containing protein [Psychrobacillus sp. MER TA 171]